MYEHAPLILIALPPAMVLGRSLAAVRNHRVVTRHSPPSARIFCVGTEFALQHVVLGRGAHPIEERLPNSPCVAVVSCLADHGDLQSVPASEGCAFTPVWIQQPCGIKLEEVRQQF